MRLSNPQTWEYEHANFNGGKMKVNLQDVPTDEATLWLEVESPSGVKDSVQIQFQSDGTVVLRHHFNTGGVIHHLIVGDASFQV